MQLSFNLLLKRKVLSLFVFISLASINSTTLAYDVQISNTQTSVQYPTQITVFKDLTSPSYQLRYEEKARASQAIADALRIEEKPALAHISNNTYWQAAGFFQSAEPEISNKLRAILTQLEQVKEKQLDKNQTSSLIRFLEQSTFMQRINLPVDLDYYLAHGKINPKLNGLFWLHLPEKPLEIKVVGAVENTINLPFKAMTSAKDYLKSAAVLTELGHSEVWVIEPNGEKSKQGIAYWNLEKTYILPGSIIFVPLKALPDQLNNDIADLLQHRVMSL